MALSNAITSSGERLALDNTVAGAAFQFSDSRHFNFSLYIASSLRLKTISWLPNCKLDKC